MSYYLNPLNALNRLREEWDRHNGLIVAVDFDSTLKPYKAFEHPLDSEEVRTLVRDLHSLGCTIIIWTAAEEERHPYIKEYLAYHKIPYNHFNEDAPQSKYKTRKLYANVFIDDRAGLYEVYTILSQLVAEKKLEALKEITKQVATLGRTY